MEVASSSETVVPVYHITWCYIQGAVVFILIANGRSYHTVLPSWFASKFIFILPRLQDNNLPKT
jgi:hypothetical protein